MQGYIITAALAASVAFGSGWQVKTWKVNSDHKKAMDEAVKAHNLQVETLEAELEARDREKFELSTRLDGALQNVRTEYRTIEKEIPRYVPQSTETCDCSLGPEFVGLFNRAATRNKGSSTSAQITPIDISDKVPRGAPDLVGGYPTD